MTFMLDTLMACKLKLVKPTKACFLEKLETFPQVFPCFCRSVTFHDEVF